MMKTKDSKRFGSDEAKNVLGDVIAAGLQGVWGPHLIVVPTSCIVNWETELKRFLPGFKVDRG